MKKYYVYETVNLIDNKYYIGKHGSEDWGRDPYYGSGDLISRAIEKHGKENFERTIIDVFETDEEAFDLEAELVTQKEVDDPMCYNMVLGGFGKTSEDMKKMWEDPEYREKQFASREKNRTDPKYIEKRSEISKKMWQDPKYREKISIKRKETAADPEFKKRQSELSKARWQDPEFREKQQESSKRVREAPGYKEKRSEISKKSWEDPERKEKQVTALKARWADPKYKERQRAIIKERWQDPEYRKKWSESRKDIPKIKCSRCGTMSTPANHGRFHGDRCEFIYCEECDKWYSLTRYNKSFHHECKRKLSSSA